MVLTKEDWVGMREALLELTRVCVPSPIPLLIKLSVIYLSCKTRQSVRGRGGYLHGFLATGYVCTPRQGCAENPHQQTKQTAHPDCFVGLISQIFLEAAVPFKCWDTLRAFNPPQTTQAWNRMKYESRQRGLIQASQRYLHCTLSRCALWCLGLPDRRLIRVLLVVRLLHWLICVQCQYTR